MESTLKRIMSAKLPGRDSLAQLS